MQYEQIALATERTDPVLYDLANDLGDVSADEIVYAALETVDDETDLPIASEATWLNARNIRRANGEAFHASVDGDRYALVIYDDGAVGVYRRI